MEISGIAFESSIPSGREDTRATGSVEAVGIEHGPERAREFDFVRHRVLQGCNWVLVWFGFGPEPTVKHNDTTLIVVCQVK